MILWIPDHFVLVIRKQFSNRVKHVLCSSCLDGFCCCFNKESQLKCQISSLGFLIQGRTPGLLSGSCCTHSWNSRILPWTLWGWGQEPKSGQGFSINASHNSDIPVLFCAGMWHGWRLVFCFIYWPSKWMHALDCLTSLANGQRWGCSWGHLVF